MLIDSFIPNKSWNVKVISITINSPIESARDYESCTAEKSAGTTAMGGRTGNLFNVRFCA